jgi:hypothetical protein
MDFKFCINTDDEHYGPPRYFVSVLERLGLRDDSNEDIVLNIDSIHHKSIKKGNKCTIYIESDEFLHQGSNKEYYDNTDLFYIYDKKYLPFYPPKTKLLKSGVDAEYHYPRDVKKEYDYVFVGRYENNPVYGNREFILKELQKSKFKILVTEGTTETYCDLMSSGKIILNIVPRRGDDACVNMRVFEGMAIGTLMSNDSKLLKNFGFIKNVHYLPIERFGEDFSDEELKRIHKAGSEFVLKNYTYQGAVKQIIKDVEELCKS